MPSTVISLDPSPGPAAVRPVIILGGGAATADFLHTIDDLLGTDNGMFPTDPGSPAARRG